VVDSGKYQNTLNSLLDKSRLSGYNTDMKRTRKQEGIRSLFGFVKEERALSHRRKNFISTLDKLNRTS